MPELITQAHNPAERLLQLEVKENYSKAANAFRDAMTVSPPGPDRQGSQSNQGNQGSPDSPDNKSSPGKELHSAKTHSCRIL